MMAAKNLPHTSRLLIEVYPVFRYCKEGLLYDQLRSHAKVTQIDIDTWKENRTKRPGPLPYVNPRFFSQNAVKADFIAPFVIHLF
jgi:hypothetical protein